MAYTLIGGTAIGTVLTLVFLPALYAIWFGVRPGAPQEANRILERMNRAKLCRRAA
jgi:Cu/Ag efflux pump CusA